MQLKNPNLPATERQLFRLHQLTNEDTRDWKLTMQQASDKIGELEKRVAINSNGGVALLDQKSEPFTEAHVTIVEGAQRSGKTTYGVGFIVDSYFNECVEIFCRSVLRVDCKCISYDKNSRIAKIRLKGESKLIRIPSDYKLYTDRRIFSNIHLYGLPYIYIPSFAQMLHWLKNGFLSNGWLLSDEAHKGMGARDSMSSMGKDFKDEYLQFGKSKLDVIIITHMARLIDWIARTVPTKRVLTEYNPKTCKVTYSLRSKGQQGEIEHDIDARQYWQYFDTNEKVKE